MTDFPVNTYTQSHQNDPAVAMDDDGDFVVTWVSVQERGYVVDQTGVYAQRFNANGEPVGGEFLVNTVVVNRQDSPAVAMDAAPQNKPQGRSHG
jgi:hypothetical protein